MRVVIGDRRSKVRFALGALLREQGVAEVIGEASDVSEVLEQAAHRNPDVLIVDWDLCARSAEPLLSALQRTCPTMQTIVLSGRPEARHLALSAGADAFVSKGDPPERLLAAILDAGASAGVL
jgi:DNA-binding NarL/FixJ family response regulator